MKSYRLVPRKRVKWDYSGGAGGDYMQGYRGYRMYHQDVKGYIYFRFELYIMEICVPFSHSTRALEAIDEDLLTLSAPPSPQITFFV